MTQDEYGAWVMQRAWREFERQLDAPRALREMAARDEANGGVYRFTQGGGKDDEPRGTPGT